MTSLQLTYGGVLLAVFAQSNLPACPVGRFSDRRRRSVGPWKE